MGKKNSSYLYDSTTVNSISPSHLVYSTHYLAANAQIDVSVVFLF